MHHLIQTQLWGQLTTFEIKSTSRDIPGYDGISAIELPFLSSCNV